MCAAINVMSKGTRLLVTTVVSVRDDTISPHDSKLSHVMESMLNSMCPGLGASLVLMECKLNFDQSTDSSNVYVLKVLCGNVADMQKKARNWPERVP